MMHCDSEHCRIPSAGERVTLNPNLEIALSEQLFQIAHRIESYYGLAGVRYMKAWCREKLPFKAFNPGFFDNSHLKEATHG